MKTLEKKLEYVCSPELQKYATVTCQQDTWLLIDGLIDLNSAINERKRTEEQREEVEELKENMEGFPVSINYKYSNSCTIIYYNCFYIDIG